MSPESEENEPQWRDAFHHSACAEATSRAAQETRLRNAILKLLIMLVGHPMRTPSALDMGALRVLVSYFHHNPDVRVVEAMLQPKLEGNFVDE